MLRPTTDYDGAWKYVAEFQPHQLLKCCFPHLAGLIDWQADITDCDRELIGLGIAATNSLRSDRLIEVGLRQSGRRVLLHLEFQSQPDRELARRLFLYAKRITDRSAIPLLTLVFLTDRYARWRPKPFHSGIGDTGLTLRFHSWKMLDHPPPPINSKTGLVEALHQMVLFSWQRSSVRQRLLFIETLFRRFVQPTRSDQEILDLLRLTYHVLPLAPTRADPIYDIFITTLEEAGMITNSRLLAPFEVTAEARGEARGKEIGERTVLLRQLRRRFPQATAQDVAAVEQIDRALLPLLADALLEVTDLADLRHWIVANSPAQP